MNSTPTSTAFVRRPAPYGRPSLRCLRCLHASAARRTAALLVHAISAWLTGYRAASAVEEYLARAEDAQDLQVRLLARERMRP